MISGRFFVIDSANGSGKTSTMKAVAERLRRIGYDVVETREPGGTELAEKLRGLILDSTNEMDSVTQLLLFNAARRSHIQQVIRPAVEAGKIVLCDRYLASSIVFQSLNPDGSPNLSDDFIIETHNRYCDGFMPDCSFYLDVPLSIRRERLASRTAAQGATPDRFEEYNDRFDIAAGEKFRLCGPMIDRDFVTIDASGSQASVIEMTLEAILSKISTPRYGALYWAASYDRPVAIMDPVSEGTQPILGKTREIAAQAVEKAFEGTACPDFKIVSEAIVRAAMIENSKAA